MAAFLSCVASNVVLAGCLAVLVMAITRIWRSPHLAHALWLLVLIKLVTLPVVHVPLDRFLVTSQVESTPDELAGGAEPAPASSLFPGGYTSPIDPTVLPLSPARGGVLGQYRGRGMWDALAANWQLWLLTAWAIGTVVFVGVAVRRHMRIFSLIAGSQTPAPALAEDAAQLARQIGLAECPPLRVTAAHICPFVTPGVKTPTVATLLTTRATIMVSGFPIHSVARVHIPKERWHYRRVFER